MNMNITCVHCGQVKPKTKMVKFDDSPNFPGRWICKETAQCIDAKYARDKKRGKI